MDRENAKNEIRRRWRELYPESRDGKGIVCPICGHGLGENRGGDGIIENPRAKNPGALKCFGCGFSGDVLDLLQEDPNLPDVADLRAAIDYAADELGLSIDPPGASLEGFTAAAPAGDGSRQKAAESAHAEAPSGEYSAFFAEAARNLNKTDYLQKRGISAATAARFGLGYVAAWRHPTVSHQVPTSPRLIIPNGPTSYLARDVRPAEAIPEKARAYVKQKVGRQPLLYNAAALEAGGPVFVVEGELDALSFEEIGFHAVGLGSVSNTGNVERALEALGGTTGALIIALDNDEPGRKGAAALTASLQAHGVPCMCVNGADLYGGTKDANAALVKDREGFSRRAAAAVQEAANIEDPRLDDYLQTYGTAYKLDAFLHDLAAGRREEPIPTGTRTLDDLLDGGLYPGLYVMGAISSLGKTTLVLQWADHIAAAGHDVLFFSLEMAREEIMAKSVSRLTYEETLREGSRYTQRDASTARAILSGNVRGEMQRELLAAGVASYRPSAARLFIVEGMGNVGTEAIRTQVQRHKDLTGRAPVVVVDYLQILAPYDLRATDKQAADRAVLDLKRLSRDFNTPVVAVSSFNRDSYQAPVSFSSFKESGGIEYGSDVVFALQYAGMDYDARTDKNPAGRMARVSAIVKAAQAKYTAGEFADLELKVLKNRKGRRDTVSLQFLALFGYFKDDGTPAGDLDDFHEITDPEMEEMLS